MDKTDIADPAGEKEYADRTFEGLSLKGGELLSRIFYNCVFRNCDFTGASFRFCKFSDCCFESCNLSLIKVSGSVFGGTSFKASKLLGVNWTEASWPRQSISVPPRFLNCVISDSNFLGLPLGGTLIKNCLARDADFRETDLSRADLTGTDFTASLFGKTNLAGADLTQARNYAIRVVDNKVKDAKFSLPEAMALLYCLDIKIV